MNHMKIIGIIGGVGSGKSSILNILEQEYDAQVIQADLVAKELMEPGEQGYEALLEALGTSILAEDRRIDRPKMADRIFRDEVMIQTVNGIIHPMVWQEIKQRIQAAEKSLVIVETALPSENHSDIYDELWYVYTSEENRINRLKAGRGYKREKTLSMMANQPSNEQFRMLADRIIDNNGSIEDTRQQLDAILKNKGQA